MNENASVLEADLDYATRMVQKGYGTAEQAAQMCGVTLAVLQARLAQQSKPGIEEPSRRRW